MNRSELALLGVPDLPIRAFRTLTGRPGSKLLTLEGGGKGDAPPPPDYTGAAQQQAQASKEITNLQTYANRPTINTPWGSQTWQTSVGTDPATGQQVTQWTSNVSLTPEQQAALDSQQAIQQGRSEAAQDLLGQATGQFQQQIDYNNMPDRAGSVDPFSFSGRVQTEMDDTAGGWRQRAQDATWQLQKPMLDERREATEVQLANQGLARGSEAWNREMRRLDDAEARAQLAAIETGRGEAAMLFDQDLAGMQAGNQAVGQQAGLVQSLGSFQNSNRAQAIAEEMQRRGYSLNELNALLTGQQVSMPQMPSNTPQSTAAASQTPNILGATQMGYDAALNSYNAGQAGWNSLLNAGTTIGSAFAFSDFRLKEDIQTLGILSSGIRVVHYRYRGLPGRYVGVIAQEVALVNPEAVACDQSGYLMVDYSKVK